MPTFKGSTVSSTLSRPNIVRRRCGIGLGVSKKLADFIKKYNISSDTVKMMYRSTVNPAITYGLRTVVLLKSNRRKVRRVERRCLQNMLKFAKKPAPIREVYTFLNGQTITRRIRVLRACYWGHIRRRPNNHLLQHALRYKVGR